LCAVGLGTSTFFCAIAASEAGCPHQRRRAVLLLHRRRKRGPANARQLSLRAHFAKTLEQVSFASAIGERAEFDFNILKQSLPRLSSTVFIFFHFRMINFHFIFAMSF
jgi:hypothetical protein